MRVFSLLYSEFCGLQEESAVKIPEKRHVSVQAAMTKLLQRLESKGFIQCVPSAKDRRYKKITCTERSAGIHHVILAQDAEVLEEFCKNFTQEQKEMLTQLTDLLLKNVDSL